jgi:hypothetical protein
MHFWFHFYLCNDLDAYPIRFTLHSAIVINISAFLLQKVTTTMDGSTVGGGLGWGHVPLPLEKK